MKKVIIYSLLLLGLLAMSAFAYLYNQYKQFLVEPVFDELPVILNVDKGSSYRQFIKLVHESGGQGSEFNWKLLGRLNSLDNSIKVGEFELTEPMSPKELVSYIDNNNVKTYHITIVEGHQWQQIKQQFLSTPLKQVLEGINDTDLKLKLGFNKGNLEGQFLPETYQYVNGDNGFDVLQRAHSDLKVVLDEAWKNRDPSISIKSPYELLILASIIEKETAQANERHIISGVFHRRLQKGIKLQTDPTVIYGVGSAYAGDITSDHLRTDTPYNTYTRKGLPPTPIAMASAASIEAAAHPNKGKELFFVANNKGGHTFSENYEQHKKAVAAYLKGL